MSACQQSLNGAHGVACPTAENATMSSFPEIMPSRRAFTLIELLVVIAITSSPALLMTCSSGFRSPP